MSATHQVSPVAKHVIEKVGGVRRVAEIIGCDPSWVYKWTYPKDKKYGRGGRVPLDAADKLLAAAQRGEVELSPADFFPGAADSE